MFSRRTTRQTLLVLLTAALLLTSCNVGAAPSPTLDIKAMGTAIVETTVAQLSGQFTQTAIAAPTNTPTPTETQATPPTLSLPTLGTSTGPTATVNPAALPTFSFVNTAVTGATQPVTLPTSQAQVTSALGDSCNNAVFEGDITIPDGETVKPGTDFQKIWAIRNTGTCTWDEGYALIQIGGSPEFGNNNKFEFKKSSDFVKGGAGVNIGVWLDAPCVPGKYEAHFRLRNDSGYFFGTVLSAYITVAEKCK